MTRKESLPSPSQQLSNLLCPGYLPSRVSGPDAERGTLLHLAAEKEEPPLILDSNDRNLVVMCLEHHNSHLQELVKTYPKYWGTKNWREVRTYREKRLPAPRGTGEKGGIIDVLDVPRHGPYRMAAVTDYKFGYKPVVPVVDNPQMIAYAMRVFSAFRYMEFVDVSILLPALRSASHHTFTRKECETKYHATRNAVLGALASSEDHTTYNPGTACSFCDRKATCPALQIPFLATIRRENQVDIPTKVWDFVAADEKQLSAYRTLASLMGDFADVAKKAVDAEVIARGMESLPEYRRIRRKETYVVNSPAEALRATKHVPSHMKNYVELIFPEKTLGFPTFMYRAVKFLHLALELPEAKDYEQAWENLNPGKSFRMFVEKKPGISYLSKVPKRGYVQMLENVLEYELMNVTTDKVQDVDPHDLYEILPTNTDNTDNS